MKKRKKETILIGVGLVLLSVILHYVHVLIFKDVHHTMIFLIADIAFIPMEVFFTTIVIDKMLERREKEHLLEKLNMLIGLFYTELGTKLLSDIVKGDAHGVMANHRTITSDTWCDKSFAKLQLAIFANTPLKKPPITPINTIAIIVKPIDKILSKSFEGIPKSIICCI